MIAMTPYKWSIYQILYVTVLFVVQAVNNYDMEAIIKQWLVKTQQTKKT
jgi:hypothetical protein